ncbi:MAG: hypothetical protein RSD09_02995 [Bacilli bacterium]
MVSVKPLLILYIMPAILIVIGIIIGFFYRLYIDYKKGRMYQNNIFRTIDIKYARQDTIVKALDSVTNFHRIKVISKDVILFMNEYDMSLILSKDYIGQIFGLEESPVWKIKGDEKQEELKNPLYMFRKIEERIKESLGNYEYKKYIIIGSLCLININLKTIKILRMNNFYYFINKVANKKRYTKEEINNLFDNLEKNVNNCKNTCI